MDDGDDLLDLSYLFDEQDPYLFQEFDIVNEPADPWAAHNNVNINNELEFPTFTNEELALIMGSLNPTPDVVPSIKKPAKRKYEKINHPKTTAPKIRYLAGPRISLDHNAPEVFSFKVKQGGRLREAMRAIADSNLNPSRVEVVQVDAVGGFKIIVENKRTQVMACLRLEPLFLEDFRCVRPFWKVLSGFLDVILQTFVHTQLEYDDAVTIYQVDGASVICYKQDGARKCQASISLCEEFDVKSKQWPANISFACAAVLKTDFLRNIIPFLVTPEGKPEAVTMDMKDRTLMISIGNQVSRTELTGRNTGVPQGQTHRSMFFFLHADSLTKASHLSQWFVVAFQSKPDRVLFRFNIENLGTLMYLNPSKIILNCVLEEVLGACSDIVNAAAVSV